MAQQRRPILLPRLERFDAAAVLDWAQKLIQQLSGPDFLPSTTVSPGETMLTMAAIPAGWLEMNGQIVSQTTYAKLFGVIGTTYNTGAEGAGNFRLPNMGAVPGSWVIKT